MNFYNKMRETSDEPNSKLFKNLSDEISLNQQENDFYSSIHEERIKNAPKIVQDYYNGDGIKQNYREVYHWFSKAIEQRNDEAKNWMKF